MRLLALICIVVFAAVTCQAQRGNHGTLYTVKDPDPKSSLVVYIAVPDEDNYMDVWATEIDTLTGTPMYDRECLFFNAKSFIMRNDTDTSVVYSVIGSRHVVVDGRAVWRIRRD